jgi:O-antigen ligase
MWLTDIIAVILFIIPFFLFFYDKKYIFEYYIISIVANLPLIFQMSFGFSYEAIVAFVILISIGKEVIVQKAFRFITTKETLQFCLFLAVILAVNLLTSLFHFNRDAYLERTIIYIVNLFILVVFSYFLISHTKQDAVKNGFLIGALILFASMIAELFYGYKTLNMHNLRPAGLLLDPNVCAFALNLCLIISFYRTRHSTLLYDAFVIATRIMILFGVFLTVSRSAYISAVVILVVLLFYYSRGKKRWLASTTVIVFIAMYFIFYGIINDFIRTIYGIIDLDRIFPTNFNTSPPGSIPVPGGVIEEPDYSNSRLLLMKSAIDIFKNNFVVGVGIGNVTTQIGQISGIPMNAHNLILQLLAESGIFILVAILIFGYYAVMLIASTTSQSRFFLILMALVIGIESVFNHNILNINIFWAVLAFFLSVIVIHAKEQKIFILNQFTLRKKHRKKANY